MAAILILITITAELKFMLIGKRIFPFCIETRKLSSTFWRKKYTYLHIKCFLNNRRKIMHVFSLATHFSYAQGTITQLVGRSKQHSWNSASHTPCRPFLHRTRGERSSNRRGRKSRNRPNLNHLSPRLGLPNPGRHRVRPLLPPGCLTGLARLASQRRWIQAKLWKVFSSFSEML